MKEYKDSFWRDLIQMIELSECTFGEKKQLLNCWAQNLNIEKTKSLKSQEIIEDIERIVTAMKKEVDITGEEALEAELIYLIDWNVCSKDEVKMLMQNYNESKERNQTMMEKPHKLFISHSSKDADYIEVFVGMLEILGLRDEEIICSSVPPYCIPLDNKVYEWLINEFQHSDLHVVYALSEDYYSSAASLNEMGAAWAMKHKWTGILLPGFQFDQLDGCIDKTQIGIKLDDPDDRTLKYRLSEFKDKLTKEFNLRPMSEATWERQRDSFLDKIVAITEKRMKESENAERGEKQHILTVGQDSVGNIPLDSAILLVYAAEDNGQILRVATLGSPVQVVTDGKRFMADNSQRESARWQEALDRLIKWGWVKPIGRGDKVYEVTGTGYTKADWLKDGMCIDTSMEPLEELKRFDNY